MRRRKTKLYLLLSGWFILSLFGVYNLYLRPGLPVDVIQSNESLFIAAADGEVRAVEAVAGIPISKRYQLEYIVEQQSIGDNVTIAFKNDASENYILIQRHDIFYVLINILVGLIFYAIALLIIPGCDRLEEYYFSIGSIFIGYVTIVSWVGIQMMPAAAVLSGIIYYISYPQILAAFVLFSFYFPARVVSPPKIAVIKRVVIGCGLLFSAVLILLHVQIIRQMTPDAMTNFHIAYRLFRLFILITLFITLFNIIRNARMETNPVNRRKLQWVLGGIVFGIFPFIFLWSVPQMVSQSPLLPEWVVNLCLIFTPLSLVVAMLRYRLFDIEVVLSRSLIYGIVITILSGVYLALTGGLSLLISWQFPVQSTYWSVFSALVLALLFNPLKSRVQHFVNRKFFRINYDLSKRVEKFLKDSESTRNRRQLLQILSSSFQEAIPVKSQQIFFKEEGGWIANQPPYPISPEMAEWLNKQPGDDREDVFLSRRKSDLLEANLTYRKIDLPKDYFIFIRIANQVYWLLGGKLAGTRFWKDDIDLASQMARTTALQWKKLAYFEIAVRESLEKEQAEKSSEWKSILVAEVAHDLRSPLNTILWKLKNLQRSLPAEIADHNQPVLDIQKQVNRLLAFVQNLLLLSKMEHGKPTIRWEKLPVKPSILDVLENLQAIIAMKCLNIDFQCSDNLFIRGDAFIFQEIIMNFVENAAKYSPEASTITLSAEKAACDDRRNMIQITIADEGSGIPEEAQQNLFQPFGGKSGSGGAKGFRLGLYIANQFTQALDGKIKLDSDGMNGTTVKLFFNDGEEKNEDQNSTG